MKVLIVPIFWLSVLILTLISCGNRRNHEESPDVTDADKSEFLSIEERNKEALAFPKYPAFISKSHRNVQLVHRPWESEFLYCKKGETAVFVKAVDSSRYLAICKTTRDEHFFYDLQFTGEINSKTEISQSPEWWVNEGFNFIIEGHLVRYYLTNKDSIEFVYDLSTYSHKRATRTRLDWDKILTKDWSFYRSIPSPSQKRIALITDVGISIDDLGTSKTDTFIHQVYTGNWAIGTGSWNRSETKFYFDNSGAVACIWELDIVNRTLDKIVPEHTASRPSVVPKPGSETVLYIDGGCIKRVVRKRKLPSIL